MKRLITILTLAALISGISVAAFATAHTSGEVAVGWTATDWVTIYIPPAVTLDPIDGGLVDPVTGLMTPITHEGTFTVRVATNDPDGVFVLVGAACDGPMPADLTRFDIRGGALGDIWHSLDTPRVLLLATDPGVFDITGIAYQYRVDLTDEPGEYIVTVIFTVTAR